MVVTMLGSLLDLRNLVGALAGYGRASEPVLYSWPCGVGAQWRCGCLACGAGFEYLEIVFCKDHYRASIPGPADVERNRRAQADRRAPLHNRRRYPRSTS
jgi:hypothetical protein